MREYFGEVGGAGKRFEKGRTPPTLIPPSLEVIFFSFLVSLAGRPLELMLNTSITKVSVACFGPSRSHSLKFLGLLWVGR